MQKHKTNTKKRSSVMKTSKVLDRHLVTSIHWARDGGCRTENMSVNRTISDNAQKSSDTDLCKTVSNKMLQLGKAKPETSRWSFVRESAPTEPL